MFCFSVLFQCFVHTLSLELVATEQHNQRMPDSAKTEVWAVVQMIISGNYRYNDLLTSSVWLASCTFNCLLVFLFVLFFFGSCLYFFLLIFVAFPMSCYFPNIASYLQNVCTDWWLLSVVLEFKRTITPWPKLTTYFAHQLSIFGHSPTYTSACTPRHKHTHTHTHTQRVDRPTSHILPFLHTNSLLFTNSKPDRTFSFVALCAT